MNNSTGDEATAKIPRGDFGARQRERERRPPVATGRTDATPRGNFSVAASLNRLVLIDGKSVFYRGYYAMGALSLKDGTPTGGVYGFAAIAMSIVDKLNPTKVVVAWDSKTSISKRRALFKDYKAGRVKPGDDFYAQIPLLEQLVTDLGWTFIELDDYEADDIIGTLSREADEAGDYETFIISSDLDMLQIVDENTHMWRILKGFTNIEQIDIPEIEAKYGIKKSQFLDLKSLKGDASDNIPGVPGIGEKTAAKLLSDFDTLDGVYEHLDEIKGATRQKLIAGKDSAYLSKNLAQIMFDAPLDLSSIPDFHFDEASVVAGLKKLEFNSLIKKFAKASGDAFPRDISRFSSPETYIPAGAEKAAQGADFPGRPAYDVEGEKVRSEKGTPDAAPNLIINWNIKTLMHSDAKIADEILSGKKPFWDLSQAAFLLDPLSRNDPQLVVPEEEYQKQLRELEKMPKICKVLTEFDLPLIPVLYKMEKKGMLIDRAYFAGLQKEYGAEVTKLEQAVTELAGKPFNLNSTLQLSEVLFYDLRLPTKGIKKTTRGYSTGAKELEKLRPLHPIIAKIIEYREASKLLSTYITPMADFADSENRIHTTFTQNVTSTGRLSSKDPNLQNIPVRTEEGKRIRTGFIAPAGKMLVSADYSQFELRLAAALANDVNLINDFNNGLDIHTKTASDAFGIPLEQVTKDQRRAAKAINFGIIYGMSAQGLAEAANMDIVDAKRFIGNYFKLRAPIKEMLDDFLRQAREEGYVETLYGRRRPTPDVKSSNFSIRQAAERAAINMPIQGTEADLMKRAMINVDKALPKGAELVMQVHDSLIVECDEGITAEVSAILQHEMEAVAPDLPVKLAVEVTVGKNWGDL